MTTQTLFLPGDVLSNDILPVASDSSHLLQLGPGLRHVPPSTITPTVAGLLFIDQKRKAIWVENNSGRYVPQVNDVVVATVHHSSTDVFHCAITPQTTFAQLPHLAFEGVSKKTRPQLSAGSLVYAKVTSASKHMDPEITCCNPSTGKSDGMGELKEGMVFKVSLGIARRLLAAKQREEGGLVILEDIAEKIPFEVAVGRNGNVWVNSKGVKEILLVGKALHETDQQGLNIDEQKKLVKRLLKTI
ncbi:exosome non-catalytic core subunit rrp40 [Xylographa carneopallida]|nr:exosome non-catalytic core subunit rrp40 [Xylographa carneopallida]